MKEFEPPRLFISFSGGRSSAVMLKLCLDEYKSTHDISIVFANTGCEDEETLRFVDQVDKHFTDGEVVWVEGVTNGPGVGASHKIVDFETASRNGEPFEAAIQKHGIFCQTHPNCTGRLKTEPMIHFMRSSGWEKGTYDVAIGIRADEADRCSSKAKENRFVYPLVKWGYTKHDINLFMAQYDWDLKLPSDAYGNCVWCWKKSRRKLLTVAKNRPEAFDFPSRMEQKYGHIDKSKDQTQSEDRVFFRGRDSALNILEQSKRPFVEYEDDKFEQLHLFDPLMDAGSGCGESCETGADD